MQEERKKRGIGKEGRKGGRKRKKRKVRREEGS